MTKKKQKLTLMDERPSFKPFQYPWAYEAWLKHEQNHWLHTEIPMDKDVYDWNNRLEQDDRDFLTNIFRFFTQGDVDVAGAYVKNYLPHFKAPEVRMMLLGFGAREALHIAAYSHLIETLGMPDSTYTQFLEYEEMRQKHDFIMDVSAKDSSNLAEQMAVFSAFTEGMQLFSTFVMLLNYPRHGLMTGMGEIVTWSITDETQHAENMIRLFRAYIEENRGLWNDELKAKLYAAAERMVELEDMFIDLCGERRDLTKEQLKQYIRFIADRRLISMGLKGIFKVKKNPLPWVELMINAPIQTNFFESRSTDYSKGALTGSWSDVWAKFRTN